MELSGIKSLYGAHLERKVGSVMIGVNVLEFLVQQAEKAETLEELLKQRLKFTEYKQTLEYYADNENYKGHPSNVEQDNGRLAREVLEMKY